MKKTELEEEIIKELQEYYRKENFMGMSWGIVREAIIKQRTSDLEMFEKIINENRKKVDYVICYGLKNNLTKEEIKMFKKIFVTLYENKLKLKLKSMGEGK